MRTRPLQVFAWLVALLGVSAASADPFPPGPHVYVEGSAEVEAPSVSASLEATYEHEDADVERGVRVVTAAVATVVSALTAAGVEPDDINVSEASVFPTQRQHDGGRDDEVSAISRRLRVTIRDLARYAEVVRAVHSGDPEMTGNLDVHSADDRALELRAQSAALADARARADLMARASGMVVTTAYSITEFDHRSQEREWLYPARQILSPEGQGNGSLALPAIRVAEPSGVNLSLAPKTVRAEATVYVIYLLQPAGR